MGKKTIVFEAELLAYIASIVLWRDKRGNRALLAFVDNNSAREVCVSRKARNTTAQFSVGLFLAVEERSSINVWISPAPSQSNPSDILLRKICNFINTRCGRLMASTISICLGNIFS